MTPEERRELEAHRRRAERDRRAREAAEGQLEDLSSALYRANERLTLATRGKLEALSRVSDELAKVQDLDLMLLRILNEARELCGAEAGAIHVREGSALRCAAAQNDRIDPERRATVLARAASIMSPVDLGSIAGATALTGVEIAIDDAQSMPPNVPYAFDARLDQLCGCRTRSVLALPLKGQEGEVIAVLELLNMAGGAAQAGFDADQRVLMRNFAGIASATVERARLTRSILTRMIRSVELRDPHETGVHAARVADLSVALWVAHATTSAMHPEEIARGADHLRIAAMLHDIGKLGISDAILKKPARLTPEEMEESRQHVILGIKLFDDVQTRFDRHARDVVLYHHARWDGTGYPTREQLERLHAELPSLAGPRIEPCGEGIPLFARIVAVADVHEALVSPRAYKQAWTVEQSLEFIQREAGKQFDPRLAALFPEVVRQLEARQRPEAA